MPKPKRKLSAEEKRRRRERRKNFEMIFVNGKQKWVPREPLIEGLSVYEFIERNADPIWLHQNEMWELMYQHEEASGEFQQNDDNDVQHELRGDFPEEESSNPF